MALSRQHLGPLMRTSHSSAIVLLFSSTPRFLSSGRKKMPGRKICRRLFCLLYCCESTGTSVLFRVFRSNISQRLVSRFVGSWGGECARARAPATATASLPVVPVTLVPFTVAGLFPLSAGKPSTDLDSLSVIKSR